MTTRGDVLSLSTSICGLSSYTNSDAAPESGAASLTTVQVLTDFDQRSTTASTSRAERIWYSSPAYLTSVPP